MDYLLIFLLFLAAASFLLLITGLFRPWVVLWWEDTQSRRKVIRLYASITIGTLLTYWIIHIATAF